MYADTMILFFGGHATSQRPGGLPGTAVKTESLLFRNPLLEGAHPSLEASTSGVFHVLNGLY